MATRTLTAARVRQLRRREKRAGRHVRAMPMPPLPFRPSPDGLGRVIATKQQLHDARAYLGRLTTLIVRTKATIDRLEHELEPKT